jgi:hypothetical protein
MDDTATMGCNLDIQFTRPPAMTTMTPGVDRLVSIVSLPLIPVIISISVKVELRT